MAAARGTTARPGTAIAIAMFLHRVEDVITKRSRPSTCPWSFHGSLAHYRGQACSMVSTTLIRHFSPNIELEADNDLQGLCSAWTT